MPVDRSHLKAGLCAMLDALAMEHPLKHQNAKARRYLLKTKTGKVLELMYEQDDETPANIWVLASDAKVLLTSKIARKASPASGLYAKKGKTGKVNYGRHSALETMPMLGKADLVYFQPETLAEAGEIIDALLSI